VAHLKPGMTLEGVVTNVAAFGAFVDIGVHQDGLVHVSAMSHNFVKDPRDVVKSGDVVKVKVLEVDEARQRIGLTLRLDDEVGAAARKNEGQRGGGQRQDRRGGGKPQQGGRERGGRDARPAPAGGSMADALRKAGFGK
jgi:protein Tex